MTDRDHFAVAALTGLLSQCAAEDREAAETAAAAMRYADAMLRERGNHSETPNSSPNLDAAPAARASVESVAPQPTTRGDSDRTDKAAPRPSEGTGDTPKPISGCVSDRPKPIASEQEPVAWGVASHFRVLATSISRIDAVDMQSDYACDTEVVPLYRKPTLTDAEWEAVEWASIVLAADKTYSSALRELARRLGGDR